MDWFDDPKQIIRRYGKTGWKVIADNECLKNFFQRNGDWQMFDTQCSGANETDWESREDHLVLTNQYLGCSAKIEKIAFEQVMSLLQQWITAV